MLVNRKTGGPALLQVIFLKSSLTGSLDGSLDGLLDD